MAGSFKQPVLKPQDLLVTLKIAILEGRSSTFASLSAELFMSASEVHACVQRATRSHLISRVEDSLIANQLSLHEFLVHGVKYAFPISLGTLTRGILTGVSAYPLNKYFERVNAPPFIWPDPEGTERGVAVCPIYPSAIAACRIDSKLYAVLTMLDALRGGAAREREIAEKLLMEYLA